MATGTKISNTINTGAMHATGRARWQTLLVVLSALVLLVLAVWLRLRSLDLPFDRDGYDEGVYWQTLRAMSAGHPLYQETFYSQPPFFVLSIYPIYTLLGQTLWSARCGIVIISLFGLLGAFLLGKALSGRIGALVALLLIVADPLYLMQSQTLQAEAPSIAFSMLGVGLAYLWWEQPDGTSGLSYAVLAAVSLALGVLSKLLVAPLVPAALLLAAQLWRLYRRADGAKWANTRPLLAAIIAFIAITAVILLPFAGAFHQFWASVVTFHRDAAIVFKSSQAGNRSQILQTLRTSPLTYAALYGVVVALLRRDWRVVPLIAWLLASLLLLWQQVPLFPHHFVALTPPLIALAVMGIGPISGNRKMLLTLANTTAIVALVVMVVTATMNIQTARHDLYLKQAQGTAPETMQSIRVARDLQQVTQSGQWIVTDAQFIAALAGRDTPPTLVDTSQVRIKTGYVTLPQLIQEASQPRVRAVLFYTDRLRLPNVAAFHAWVAQHFHLVHDYGQGRELWIRV